MTLKRFIFLIAFSLIPAIGAAITGWNPAMSAQDPPQSQDAEAARQIPGFASPAGKMVIANRASGTISVIDAASDQLIGNYALPSGPNAPEPMYVVHSHGRVFVGDRMNNRVVVFNSRTFVVETTVPAGRGVFHMWADPFGRQLWVNNDVDKTSTVIDPITLEVLATVTLPADLTASGRPHDVILDPSNAQSAYVTMIGVAGAFDYVVKFSTRTFQEVGRAAVGKDPHVSAAAQNNLLYVPCQNSNALMVLNRETLAEVTTIQLPAAHGAGMAYDGNTFYTTNIAGGGVSGLWTINTSTNTVTGAPLDTPYATPHNIALTPDRGIFSSTGRGNRKLFLTHSGATSNKVTIYKLRGNQPVYHREIIVGLNPFGLAYVP